MTYEWTELTYLQLLEGNAAYFAFAGAVVLVYLVLAAQYEDYTLPLAIILVVPMCLLGVAGRRGDRSSRTSTSSCRSASSYSWAWRPRTRF